MKVKNSLISCLLVLSIVLAFGACGKESKEETTTDSTIHTTEAQPTEATEKTEETTPSTDNNSTSAEAPETVPVTSPEIPETEAQVVQPVIPTGVSSKIYESNGSIKKQIVYFPASLEFENKKYPIVAWANGTMCTPDLYTDLLKDIAEGGFIVIASYETMSADGTAQIDSIDLMISENSNNSSLFYQKVNTEKVAVIGHSQGGRSSVNVASSDSRVDCVVSIAGSNFDYEAEKNAKPTLFLAGSNDIIVNKDQWIIPAYDLAKGSAVYACLDGAIHTTCCTEPEKYSPYIISWLNGWLKGDSSAKAIFKDGGKFSQDTAWTDFACKNI